MNAKVIKQKPKRFTYLKYFTRLKKRVIQQAIFKMSNTRKVLSTSVYNQTYSTLPLSYIFEQS